MLDVTGDIHISTTWTVNESLLGITESTQLCISTLTLRTVCIQDYPAIWWIEEAQLTPYVVLVGRDDPKHKLFPIFKLADFGISQSQRELKTLYVASIAAQAAFDP